jgi:hypothetical protein
LINSLSTPFASFAVKRIILDVFIDVSGAINYIIKTNREQTVVFFLYSIHL